MTSPRPLRLAVLTFVLFGTVATQALGAGPSTTASQPSGITVTGPGSPAAAAKPPLPTTVILRTIPAHPVLGAPLEIVVVNPPAGATEFRWTLPGAPTSPLDTGTQPMVTTRLVSPGPHSVAVQAVAGGGVITGTLAVVVLRAAGLPGSARHAGAGRAGRAQPAAHRSYTVARPARARANPSAAGVRAVAHAASDPGVDIIDFAFGPATITVHVGDTVTWTNTGKQPHTATASNGSFDTGILTTGRSASHTFAQAGTFTYICTVHPYMHGTIVVAAAASAPSTPASSSTAAAPAASSKGASSSSPATNPAAAASQAASGAALPLTGLDVRLATALGLLLIGLGWTLRRRLGAAD